MNMSLHAKRILPVMVSLALVAGCDDGSNGGGGEEPEAAQPVRTDCVVTIEGEARSEGEMRLVGQWCEWKYEYGIPMERDGSVWRVRITSTRDAPKGAYILPAGRYQYKLVADGSDWRLDTHNPYTAYDKTENIENSLLFVPDCSVPSIEEDSLVVDATSHELIASFRVRRPPSSEVEGVEVKVERDFSAVNHSYTFDRKTGLVTVTVSDATVGKYWFYVTATTADGHSASRAFPAWYEERERSWDELVMYFAFTDRFANGDPSNDAPVEGLPELVNWHGGDFRGITEKIEEGYFEELGISAIWISTPHDNPDGALPGDCNQYFTGYHAYWPQGERTVENHFGTEEDLRELVRVAHAHGIRIVVDWPANHVYLDHPLYAEYSGNPFWFNYPGTTNPSELWRNKCGVLGWNEYALTCWFTEYLPDLNHRNQALVDRLIDDALWWIRTFDLDGFRVDATKHIRSNYLRLLRRAVDSSVGSRWAPFYMVGENFYYDYGVIGEKISPHELPGQFDFPLFGTIRGVFLAQPVDFTQLDSFVHATLLDGHNPIQDLDWGQEGRLPSGTLLGTFIGNHDVERFISLAAGQANGDGCQVFNEGSPPQPRWPDYREAYERMASAFTFLMTVRGLPVVYYGDEIALAGVRDPDNRRPMVWDRSQWNEGQRLVFETLKKVIAARNAHPALSIGSFATLGVSPGCYVYLKKYGDDMALVVLGGGSEAQSVEVELPQGVEVWHDIAGEGEAIVARGSKTTITCSPWQRSVYVPAQ